MKKTGILMGLVWMGGLTAQGSLSPEDILSAVDRMTPGQVQELQQKLEAKLWSPVPEGFFTRMSMDMGASYSALDTVDLSSVSLSGGAMGLDRINGANFGLLWRVSRERFRIGLRFDDWFEMDSNVTDEGYSRAEIRGGLIAIAFHYQWVRSPRWILWTEMAPGFGKIALETVDTPAGQPTTLRAFDQTFSQVDFMAGLSWRLNSVISLLASGGYRLAESVDLDEGGRATAVSVDAGGFTGRIGLGINF